MWHEVVNCHASPSQDFAVLVVESVLENGPQLWLQFTYATKVNITGFIVTDILAISSSVLIPLFKLASIIRGFLAEPEDPPAKPADDTEPHN